MKTNMTARRRLGTIARWGACFAVVLGAHTAAAMAMLDWHTNVSSIVSAPAIFIDLAPAPAAPATKQNNLPPGPQRPQAQPAPQVPAKAQLQLETTAEPAPNPIEKSDITAALPTPLDRQADIKPQPASDLLLTAMPPPRPVIRPQHAVPRQRHASLTSAPSAAMHRAARAAAPAPGAARRESDAMPNWKSRLLAQLERYKRYPDEAERRGDHGVAQLAFDVDRRGGVHDVRILRSSGSSLLDRATLALARRAAPLPPPPADLPGRRIPIVVPIRYSIR